MMTAATLPAHAKKINATAIRDTHCQWCRGHIAKGERCAMFRERAVSYREAMHAGTMRPMRRWCATCATK